jgi:BA14K-like protein
MTRLGILGATALSLSLAVASPALAQQHMRGGAAVHASGGANFGATRSGSFNAGPQANFRGANAAVASPNRATVAAPNVTARTGSAQFAEGRRGEFRDRDRRFGAGAGFVAGVAAGSALGYGYGYDPYYYGDDYAYYDGGYYDPGYVVGEAAVPDASWCAAQYRSYDPATGTYLGFDGLRHPCP